MAEQPRGMQPLQQRPGYARALDLVGRGDDLRPKLAGAGDRSGLVWMSMRHLILTVYCDRPSRAVKSSGK